MLCRLLASLYLMCVRRVVLWACCLNAQHNVRLIWPASVQLVRWTTEWSCRGYCTPLVHCSLVKSCHVTPHPEVWVFHVVRAWAGVLVTAYQISVPQNVFLWGTIQNLEGPYGVLWGSIWKSSKPYWTLYREICKKWDLSLTGYVYASGESAEVKLWLISAHRCTWERPSIRTSNITLNAST